MNESIDNGDSFREQIRKTSNHRDTSKMAIDRVNSKLVDATAISKKQLP